MAMLNNLAQAAKDFFVEPGGEAPAADAPRGAGPPASPTPPPRADLPPGTTQPEQRHLDHVARLLAGDGKDFGARRRAASASASQQVLFNQLINPPF